ncbi:MAG: phosphopentomutase [Ignavibacteriae bacterium]|nr:phosphopentomutase [Ignavibacteriota bacterium]
MKNFILIILDGVGIGELPDAKDYGDVGSDTLGNLSQYVNGLTLPNLQKFGLANIKPLHNYLPVENPQASFGKMKEISIGKDSTSGHWEMAGLTVDFKFPTYASGFPTDLLDNFISKTKVKGILGNKVASGTDIISELGKEHMETGLPIVYTSADSVFQIAAHEDVISVDELYNICEITRKEVCINEHNVGRIIARPFIGEPGNFKRTTNRKDFSVNPTSDTILDLLSENGTETIGIGKVNDLFNNIGIQTQIKTKSNSEGIKKIVSSIKSRNNSFIFANLVDFDVYFGHRLDPEGFHNCLIEFDNHLPEIIAAMDESDSLILSADHGNDPTSTSTDHSREYVPVLYYTKNSTGKNLGTRETFSDVAQTIAHYFGVNNTLKGTSFLEE